MAWSRMLECQTATSNNVHFDTVHRSCAVYWHNVYSLRWRVAGGVCGVCGWREEGGVQSTHTSVELAHEVVRWTPLILPSTTRTGITTFLGVKEHRHAVLQRSPRKNNTREVVGSMAMS